MTRARSGKTVLRGRKRMRKLTKGFRLSRHNLYRQAVVTLIRARVYAYRDRRVRKREFRRLWIVRVNAACRMRGLRYSEFIAGLQRARVELNRKTLAELAVHDPDVFTRIVDLARKYLPARLLWTKVRPCGGVSVEKRAEALFELIKRKDRELQRWILSQLQESGRSDPEWRNALVVAACEVQFSDPEERRQLQRWMLDVARDLNAPGNERTQPILWAALRRYASMIASPERELGALAEFLSGATPGKTRQAALQCIQNVFAARPAGDPVAFDGIVRKVSEIASHCLGKTPSSDGEGALALNALCALAALGGSDLPGLASRIKEDLKATWLVKLTLRRFKGIMDGWAKAAPPVSPDHPALKRLRESVAVLSSGIGGPSARPS
jgi:large subunit ribosomal protein L20